MYIQGLELNKINDYLWEVPKTGKNNPITIINNFFFMTNLSIQVVDKAFYQMQYINSN